MHKQAQRAWHVSILTFRIQSQAGLLVTVLQQLPAWFLWHQESQSSGWEFPVWSQLKFSMSYSQSRHTQCLWDLSSSGTQPTDVVIAFMVYGGLGGFPTSQGDSPTLALGFSFSNLTASRRVLSHPCMVYLLDLNSVLCSYGFDTLFLLINWLRRIVGGERYR